MGLCLRNRKKAKTVQCSGSCLWSQSCRKLRQRSESSRPTIAMIMIKINNFLKKNYRIWDPGIHVCGLKWLGFRRAAYGCEFLHHPLPTIQSPADVHVAGGVFTVLYNPAQLIERGTESKIRDWRMAVQTLNSSVIQDRTKPGCTIKPFWHISSVFPQCCFCGEHVSFLEAA